ncbi:MAG: hypothetical protein K9L82_15930 [Chromatiaceae bacterium]|nr:hypothetical protein [Chromatiaceae bacterium]
MNLRSQIVNYWSSAGLSCPVSSTSSADPEIAKFDNIIENRVLNKLLSDASNEQTIRTSRGYALDVGAGYGRFTKTFLKHFEKVFLLEGAPSIYSEMLYQWSGSDNVACLNGVFEDLQQIPVDNLSLIFASGVLYLYDDSYVDQFLSKATDLLAREKGGRIILRDFVCPKSRVLNSKFVEGGFCYYRDESYWVRACLKHNLELVKIVRSKPKIRFFRSRLFKAFARRIKIMGLVFGSKRMQEFFFRYGGWSLESNDVHTVFIEIKRDVRYCR